MISFNLKRYLPKKLFARGIVMIAGPILLLQIVIVYLILERHWDRVSEQLSANTAREIAMLIAEPDRKRQTKLARQLGFSLSFAPDTPLSAPTPVTAFDFIYNTFNEALKKEITNPLWLDTKTLSGSVDVRIASHGGVLQIIVPVQRVYALRAYQIIIWVSLTAILVMGIAILFLRNQVRPIQRLAVAAKRFGRGLEVHDFTPTGANEVREAGHAFLTMRDNLRAHIAQRTDMLSAISHDLRTSITRLKLQVALFPDDKNRAALENDISKMEKMLLGYLDFARGESREEKPSLVDLSQLVRDLVAPYKQVRLTCPENLTMRLGENAMRRCLDNLFHNAITYGKQAEIEITQSPAGVEVVIDDDGPGIKQSDYNQAFRAFVRLDEARNQNINGTGLGLAIARDIIQAAGGTIELASSPLGGLRVKLFLPF